MLSFHINPDKCNERYIARNFGTNKRSYFKDKILFVLDRDRMTFWRVRFRKADTTERCFQISPFWWLFSEKSIFLWPKTPFKYGQLAKSEKVRCDNLQPGKQCQINEFTITYKSSVTSPRENCFQYKQEPSFGSTARGRASELWGNYKKRKIFRQGQCSSDNLLTNEGGKSQKKTH